MRCSLCAKSWVFGIPKSSSNSSMTMKKSYTEIWNMVFSNLKKNMFHLMFDVTCYNISLFVYLSPFHTFIIWNGAQAEIGTQIDIYSNTIHNSNPVNGLSLTDNSLTRSKHVVRTGYGQTYLEITMVEGWRYTPLIRD